MPLLRLCSVALMQRRRQFNGAPRETQKRRRKRKQKRKENEKRKQPDRVAAVAKRLEIKVVPMKTICCGEAD